jgi:hypothetical protein
VILADHVPKQLVKIPAGAGGDPIQVGSLDLFVHGPDRFGGSAMKIQPGRNTHIVRHT